MAIIDNGLSELKKPTPRDLRAWDKWVASRPEKVKAVAEKLPPWFYYDMPKTGQIVTIVSYSEDGTVTVHVRGDRISIPAIVEFHVFDVSPDDLVKRV